MIKDMLAYYRMIRDNDINIIYSGPIWSDGIEGIGGTLRKRLEFDDLPLSAAQSVFSVFVEQMNNMLMYSAEKENFKTSDERNLAVARGIFVLGSKDRQYFIQSGNIMKDEHVAAIKEKLDFLNTLDKTELRKYYKERIKDHNPNPHSRGAGLGLIEIARRASSPIEYGFTPQEPGLTFFTMYVTIG